MPSNLHPVPPQTLAPSARGAAWALRAQQALRDLVSRRPGARGLWLLGALALLAVLGAFAAHRVADAAAQAADSQRAQQALAVLAQLQLALTQAESGPPDALPQARATLRTHQDSLRTLLAGSAEQYSRLVALGPLLARRTEQLATPEPRPRVAVAAPGSAPAIASEASEAVRRTQQRLAAALAEVDQEARADLQRAQQRSQAAADAARQLVWASIAAGLLLASLALLHGQRTAAALRHLRAHRSGHEAQQQQLAQLHQRLLASSLAPICFIDAEGRISQPNPACTTLWGDTPLQGQAFVNQLLPEDQRKAERALAAAAAASASASTGDGATATQTLDLRWRHTDGRVLHLQCSLLAADARGNLVCVLRDASAEQRLSCALADGQQALRKRNDDMALQGQRLQAAEARLDGFLATLNRCLRAPLGSVIKLASNGQQGLACTQDEIAVMRWTKVLERARGLQDVVDNVLDLGRAQAGLLPLQNEAFDVAETVEHTVGLVRPLAERKQLKLPVKMDAELGYAHGDTRRFEQALQQVLREAVASTREGEVLLTVRREPADRLRLDVAHLRAEGHAQGLDELLAPLQDPDQAASAERLGLLLGLATARGLVQRMGGDLRGSLQPPRGFVFELELPADRLPGS
jgi:signal transduction histidine kinase